MEERIRCFSFFSSFFFFTGGGCSRFDSRTKVFLLEEVKETVFPKVCFGADFKIYIYILGFNECIISSLIL